MGEPISLKHYDDERLVRSQMKLLTESELWSGYKEWDEHCVAMERPNTYMFLAESYAYAKLRRDDFREELRRRGKA